MALQILQFSVVFAVGYSLGLSPGSNFPNSYDTPSKNLSFSLKLSNPKDVTVQRGQSATLKCSTGTSKGDVEFTWLHNEEPIPLNDSRWNIQTDGSLYIPKVSIGKKANGVVGEYRCLVENKEGAILSNIAKLKVASIEQEFSKNPSNQTVRLGQTVALRCSIHSTPPVDIKWEYNNLPLPHDERYVPLPNGFLFIQNFQESDTGSYRCKGFNGILNKVRYSKSAVLLLTSELTNNTSPVFLPLDFSTNITVYIEESLSLFCPVTGWPTPTVQWFNNDGIVIANSTAFHIQAVKPNDTGNYMCSAQNSLGRANKNFRVDVWQKPYFTVFPISKAFPSSSTVKIECRASGVPEPKITWLKNGKQLKFDARIKKQVNRLFFSNSVTGDSGIYQCVASNVAGKIWSAARLLIIPGEIPPRNIECRPYDSSSICLTWRPPLNVTVQAYSIHYTYKTSDGLELFGPEYVTNMTYQTVEGLNSSTNYTFFVRLYTKSAASDFSEKVTCKPGIIGDRNLKIELIKFDSILLKWDEISVDRSCDEKRNVFKVHWRDDNQESAVVDYAVGTNLTLTELLPGNYEFRIVTDYDIGSWTSFTIPSINNNSNIENVNTNATNTIPSVPIKIEGFSISGTSVQLSWLNLGKKSKFFIVCYIPIDENKNCEDGKVLKSFVSKLQIDQLKSNTTYEFKVRSYNSEEIPGPFSKPVTIKTLEEVPSSVLELNYKIINDSTICLHWEEPEHNNGKIQKYIISYTPDKNWLLEQWLNVTTLVHQQNTTNCLMDGRNGHTISVFLGNLSSDAQYTVFVRAVSEVGIGDPTYPLIVNTKVILPAPKSETEHNQKVGIIIGTIIALICIMLCILCILMRRRCLKQRALARARTAASNNYYPAMAQYASHVGTVQVRLEDRSSTLFPENENFVQERPTVHISPLVPNHCDAKRSEEYLNGHVNGTTKPYMNGHISHNHVHITENPQVSEKFYTFERNGQEGTKHSKSALKLNPLEEDSNSNVKSSKFYDLYRLFENSKKSHPKYQQCSHDPHPEEIINSIHGSCEEPPSDDEDLNMTQLTHLNDSLSVSMVNNNRMMSPIIGPNG